MNMKVFDHETLLAMNGSSIRAERSQTLRPERLPSPPQDRYWVNAHMSRERDGQQEVRMCVVLSPSTGQTAWLDVSAEEFDAIPEIDVPTAEWETVMCAGTPPRVP